MSDNKRMPKPVKIVGGVLVRDPEWSDDEYAQRLENHRANQRLGATHLLSIATQDVIREIMALPDDADADAGHLRHCSGIAEAVARIADRDGYWTPGAEKALADLKSAVQQARDLMPIDAEDDEHRRQTERDAVEQLRLLDQLPDNIDAMQEVAEAVLRRSTLSSETVEFLVSRHRRNRAAPADHTGQDGTEWQLQGDPGESNDDYERRQALLTSSPALVTDKARRLKAAITEIADVTGLDSQTVMRVIGMEFFREPD